MSNKKEVTFESLVNEFIEKTTRMCEKKQEAMETLPFYPWDLSGPPFTSPVPFDADTIRRYAASIGEDNPLYTDPDYGNKSVYGSQIAPGPMLALVRYPSAHGASNMRPEGYPIANFISGAAWEFFDVLRVGDRFKSSQKHAEFVDKKGSKGRLLFIISDNSYWRLHGDLVSKSYGTQIMIPQETMGTSRTMDLDKMGTQMLYDRGPEKYSQDDIDKIVNIIEGNVRRGPVPLYWEDVNVGDEIPPIILPPWTLQDQIVYHNIGYGAVGGPYAWESAYHHARYEGGAHARRTHPVTLWPWTPAAEHEDALLAGFRNLSLPFDFGVQRLQIPQKLLSDWMGDYGFIRRMYCALRKVNFYADYTIFKGEVVKKYIDKQKGNKGPGGVPGKADYAAVGIRFAGVNQNGETQTPGTATVYLPSRELGMVQLPIPHPAKPRYVPFDIHRREWY
jgi:hypothetical protein